jgi:hypothetical protein
LLFPAFTYAWVATLLTGPLLGSALWMAGGQLLDDVVSYLGVVQAAYAYAWLAWGIPGTVLGLLTWPMTRWLLMRAGVKNRLLKLAYGAALGALCAVIVGGGAIAASSGLQTPGSAISLGVYALIGAATGLIWAIWYLLFALWIGAEQVEAS